MAHHEQQTAPANGRGDEQDWHAAFAFPRLRASDTLVVHLRDPGEARKEVDIASRGVLLWAMYRAARKASMLPAAAADRASSVRHKGWFEVYDQNGAAAGSIELKFEFTLAEDMGEGSDGEVEAMKAAVRGDREMPDTGASARDAEAGA